jgi:hypothetical protein
MSNSSRFLETDSKTIPLILVPIGKGRIGPVLRPVLTGTLILKFAIRPTSLRGETWVRIPDLPKLVTDSVSLGH